MIVLINENQATLENGTNSIYSIRIRRTWHKMLDQILEGGRGVGVQLIQFCKNNSDLVLIWHVSY